MPHSLTWVLQIRSSFDSCLPIPIIIIDDIFELMMRIFIELRGITTVIDYHIELESILFYPRQIINLFLLIPNIIDVMSTAVVERFVICVHIRLIIIISFPMLYHRHTLLLMS